MGVVAGDFDGDGDADLFMTHLIKETNTLYLNDGRGIFSDVTAAAGLASGSLPFTSFGTAPLDYDNDGRLDLLVINGAVTLLPTLVAAGDPFPLHQTNQLFHNEGAAGGGTPRFVDVTDRAGEVFELSEVGRGLARGDVDNDGDLDALVVNNGGPVRLLLNQVGSTAPWLGARVRLAGPADDALGARVTVRWGGQEAAAPARPDRWQLRSAGDPRLLFGLGGRQVRRSLAAVWPNGRTMLWRQPPTGTLRRPVASGGQWQRAVRSTERRERAVEGPSRGATGAALAATAAGRLRDRRSSGPGSDPRGLVRTPRRPTLFVDRAAAAGIDFVHVNGMVGEYHMAELIGAGAALFDYDGDGDLDAYLVQGSALEPPAAAPRPAAGDRLFRNDTRRRRAALHRRQLPAAAPWPAATAWASRSATTTTTAGSTCIAPSYGPNRLLRNRGDGSFEDAPARRVPRIRHWSVPATFLDYDRDGWLDLFVGNYLAYAHPPTRFAAPAPAAGATTAAPSSSRASRTGCFATVRASTAAAR